LRSPREIGLIRKAGQVVAEALALARSLAVPGACTRDIDNAVAQLFEERGAVPLFKNYPGPVPFPAVTCISVNEEVVHGIPGDRRLQEGDIVSIDTGCRLNEWCGDSAITVPVGNIRPEIQRLLTVAQETLDLAIREMGRCKLWSEVAAQMEAHVRGAGFSVVEEFVGHGIGRKMHEDPQVPNFVSKQLKKHDFALEKGLVIAVEPMVNFGTKKVEVLQDHWTVVTLDRKPSAHVEHTIAMVEDDLAVPLTLLGDD